MERKEEEEVYIDHRNIDIDIMYHSGLLEKGRKKLSDLLKNTGKKDLYEIFGDEIKSYVTSISRYMSRPTLDNKLCSFIGHVDRNYESLKASRYIKNREKIVKYAHDNLKKFVKFSSERVEKEVQEDREGDPVPDFGYLYFTKPQEMSDFIDGKKGLRDVIHAYLEDHPTEFHGAVIDNEIDFYYKNHPLARVGQVLSDYKRKYQTH